MFFRVNAQFLQRFQIGFLNIVGRRLHNNLELMVLVETVRVFTVTAVIRTAGWFYIGHIPGFRSDNPKESGRIHGACTLFRVVSFAKYAALFRPELLEC